MLLNIAIGFGVLLVVFIGYALTKPTSFHYERSAVINESAEKIFPYISNLKLGVDWSPYEKVDPNIKKSFYGTDGQVGSVMVFEGNRDTGSGRLELLKIVPNEIVEIRLTMTKPFRADNLVIYKLTPEAGGTRFSWSMSGNGGFMTQIMETLIDCEKLIGGQFSQGIENLKVLIENK